MTTEWKPPQPGALDDTPWPTQLPARAVARHADDDRLHGYAILGDLARHYAFSDLCYLGIIGELPDDRAASLFRVSLAAGAAAWAGEAPTHIAILARLSGGSVGSAVAAGVIAAADELERMVAAHAELIAALDAGAASPTGFTAHADPWVGALIAACGDYAPPSLRADLSRPAATLALLHAAGVRAPDRMVAALLIARVAGLPAEALVTGPEHLGSYPVKVPEFRYVEG